jgi:hypothetical protein
MNITIDSDVSFPAKFLHSAQIRLICAEINANQHAPDVLNNAQRCKRIMESYSKVRRTENDYPMEIAVLTSGKFDYVKPYVTDYDGTRVLIPSGRDALRLTKIYKDQGIENPGMLNIDIRNTVSNVYTGQTSNIYTSKTSNTYTGTASSSTTYQHTAGSADQQAYANGLRMVAHRTNRNPEDQPLINSIMAERLFVTDQIDAEVSKVLLRVQLPKGYVYIDLDAGIVSSGQNTHYYKIGQTKPQKPEDKPDYCWNCLRNKCKSKAKDDCECHNCKSHKQFNANDDCLCKTCESKRVSKILKGKQHSSAFMVPKRWTNESYKTEDPQYTEIDIEAYIPGSPGIQFVSTRTLLAKYRRIDARLYVAPVRRPYFDGVRFDGLKDDLNSVCEWCSDVPPALNMPEGPTQSFSLNRKLHALASGNSFYEPKIHDEIGEIPRLTRRLLNDVGEELTEEGYSDIINIAHPAILKALDTIKNRLVPAEFGLSNLNITSSAESGLSDLNTTKAMKSESTDLNAAAPKEYPFAEFAKSTFACSVLTEGVMHELKAAGETSKFFKEYLNAVKPKISAIVDSNDRIVLVIENLIEDRLVCLTSYCAITYIIESECEEFNCRMLPSYNAKLYHNKTKTLYLGKGLLSRKVLRLPALN